MVLNNLTNLLKNLAIFGGSGSITMPEVVYPVKDTNGNTFNKVYLYGNPFPLTTQLVYGSNPATLNGTTNLHLGTGTTPATKDDFTMENTISQNISVINSTVNVRHIADTENNTHTKKITLVCGVQNTGSADLTISEIGISGMCYKSSSSNDRKNVLFYRDVLDSPMTIPANSIRTLQFDFEFTNQLG